MTKRIFKSIFLVSLGVLLSCLLLILGALYSYFGRVQRDQLKTELDFAAAAVEEEGISYLGKIDAGDCRLTYISKEGWVLYDSKMETKEMENHKERKEVKEALETGRGESSRYSSTLTEETMYDALRLSDGTILRISTSRKTVLSLLFGMAWPIFFILLAALTLSGTLAHYMSKKILKPLNSLDLDHPLENDSYDELSPLFTRMEQQHRKIDDQKRELFERKREFYAVIENMSEGLVLLNGKGRILSINPAAAYFFKTESDSVGRDFFSIERNHEIAKSLNTAETEGHSELKVSRMGREYQMNISRIGTGNQTFGTVILIFDNTEKMFAERNRREFTGNVSHELKTPLHSIMGSAELLENGLAKPEDVPRFSGHIRMEAGRLLAMVEDIIQLSQLDEGAQLPGEEVDLYELAKQEIAALGEAARQKEVSLFLKGQKEVLFGAKQLMHEIIYNLCDNAIKYNVQGGSVTVTVGKNQEGIFLKVADTGMGIPKEHQERVFERFYRVDKSRSKFSGGTGLGLSIVKHGVQHLGGQVSLDSEVGEGTEVTVVF